MTPIRIIAGLLFSILALSTSAFAQDDLPLSIQSLLERNSLASMPGPTNSDNGNFVGLVQHSQFSEALVLQSGESNYLQLSQYGVENQFQLAQYGTGNQVVATQAGSYNEADILQYGDYNTVVLEQFGHQGSVMVQQFGYQSAVTITQY